MSSYLNWIIALTAGLALFYAPATQAQGSEERSRVWLNIRWEVRYLLYVTTEARLVERQLLAKEKNRNDHKRGKRGKRHVYLDAMELIKEAATFATAELPNISTAVITFDESGHAANNDALHGLIGKRSVLDYLVLVRENAPYAKPYGLLYWSQGIPGNLTFGPGPCTMLDILRYQDDWQSGDYPGDFGCREWTAQLFNDDHPYIDVTTYTERGNFIGEFVGWSRFKDVPKPVIGMNGKTWLCLHECPDGETPGVIADIKAWTRKHGYPLPEPPGHQPQYPNRNYQDDIDTYQGE